MGLVGMIAVFAVHGRRWRWTGFDRNTSLWSWLQTFAQPLAFVYLAMRLISSAQSWGMWRIAGAITGVLLTATSSPATAGTGAGLGSAASSCGIGFT